MRRVVLTILVVAALCVALGRAHAQTYGTELPFVLGTDARISGMGLAGVSLRGNASLQYYNPASMSYLQWKQFVFFRSVLFESDALYHTMSYGHPLLNYGTIGISVLRVDVGGIEERDGTNQLLSQDLHSSQTRILLGYSKHVTASVATGFNFKIDNQSFGSYSGSGVGLDVGIAATQHFTSHRFLRGLRQGFVIQNLLEPAVKLDQEKVSDPMQVGLGLTILTSYKNAFMETALDLVNPRFSPVRLQLGQEVTYANHYSFRFGVNGGSPSYGLGAEYKSAALDYAYRSTDVGGNHQFSVSFKFGPSVSQQRGEARARLEHEVNNEINLRMDALEQSQITSALHQGDSLFALGEYNKAGSRFESALLWAPDNDHAREYLTHSRYGQFMGQATDAVESADYVQGLFYSKQALELVPSDTGAQAMVNLCNKRITESQNSAELVNNLLKTSIDFYANRQFTKALSGFEELVRIDPTNDLADEYRRKCRLQLAELANNHVRQSQQAANAGDYHTAVEELQRALTYKPRNKSLQRQLAALEAKHRDATSVPALLTAPEPQPTVAGASTRVNVDELDKKYKQGMEFFSKGRFDKAVGLFMEVWTTDPEFHDVSKLLTKSYLLIGMRLYSRDDYVAAINVWNKALAVDPDNVKVKRYLSRTDAEFKKSQAYNDQK